MNVVKSRLLANFAIRTLYSIFKTGFILSNTKWFALSVMCLHCRYIAEWLKNSIFVKVNNTLNLKRSYFDKTTTPTYEFDYTGKVIYRCQNHVSLRVRLNKLVYLY